MLNVSIITNVTVLKIKFTDRMHVRVLGGRTDCREAGRCPLQPQLKCFTIRQGEGRAWGFSISSHKRSHPGSTFTQVLPEKDVSLFYPDRCAQLCCLPSLCLRMKERRKCNYETNTTLFQMCRRGRRGRLEPCFVAVGYCQEKNLQKIFIVSPASSFSLNIQLIKKELPSVS